MTAIDNASQVKDNLDNFDTKYENKLTSITKEIRDLTDEDETNDKIELAGKLNSELATTLKDNPSLTKELSKIIGEINEDGFSTENKQARKELKDFIAPYDNGNEIGTFNITTSTTEGEFYKNIDSGDVDSATSLINKLKDKLGNDLNNELKTTLENIGNILKYPNKDNTKALQNFLLSQLEGEAKDNFVKKNFKGNEKNEPDGKFGKGTFEGLFTFLGKTREYINQLVNSKKIQEDHDKIKEEKETIDRLNINDAMKDLPIENEDKQTITNLIEKIGNIELREDLSGEQLEQKQSELNNKIEEAKNLDNDIKNWNTDKQKSIQYFKDNNMRNNTNKERVKDHYSEENYNKAKEQLIKLNEEIAELQDRINGKKPNRIMENIQKIEDYYNIKIGNLAKDIEELKKQKKSETDGIPRALKERLQVEEKGIDDQIKKNNTEISKILEFFCRERNETTGEISNDENKSNNYKLYKQKYEALIKKDDDE